MAAAQSPALSEAKPTSVSNSVAGTASELSGFPHYKELHKNLRNNVKKLNATAKVDAIIAENPKKTLDELVAEKKINNDQKAQALKKPALQAAVSQLEEQIGHYKEFATFYEQRLTSQNAELEKTHKELEALREEAANAPAAQAAPEAKKEDFSQQLLRVAKFLCAAAVRRHRGLGSEVDTLAFEGVLAQVYSGDLNAVVSMQKLIDGTDEKVSSVEGNTLDITYSQVIQISEETKDPEAAPTSDPTAANAASTELQDPTYTTEAASNEPTGSAAETENVAPPPQTLVSDGANAVAEAAWEPHNDPLASSTNTDGFVEIPRNPAETDTGLQATPANINADVAPEETSVPTTKPGDNGLDSAGNRHQRQPSFRGRGRGRGRGRADFRGRGRGGRGGRGRGGPNGAPAATPASQ